MSSISDLMKGKKPGEIKVRAKGWPTARWFRPFYSAGGCWYGPGFVSDDESYGYSGDDWELFAKPVKMEYRWMWSNINGTLNSKLSATPYTGPVLSYTIKLEWSKTSFPKETT